MIARRRALLFLLALLQLDAIWSIRPRQLEPLLWSVHNPMFSRETDATLDVQIGEFINFVCPRQETGGDAGNAATEYHCIYMVSKHEYDECRVDGLERRKPVLKCDRPHDSLKYTLYISRYSPVPGAIEFMPGSSYYFISTSNGTKNGLHNPTEGTCKSNNMRLVVKVLESKSIKSIQSASKPPAIVQTTRNSQDASKPSTTTSTTSPLARSFFNSSFSSKAWPGINRRTKNLSTTATTTTTTTTTPLTSTSAKLITAVAALTAEKPHDALSPIATSATSKSKTTSTPTPANDIFILEPVDTVDYSELINELINSDTAPSSASSSDHSPNDGEYSDEDDDDDDEENAIRDGAYQTKVNSENSRVDKPSTFDLLYSSVSSSSSSSSSSTYLTRLQLLFSIFLLFIVPLF